MMKKPIRNMVYLAQAEANIQLLDDMEKPDAEEAFDLKAERVLLEENKVTLGDADVVFNEIAAELRKTLGMNYVVPINVADIVISPRIEISAKSVGINAASGSNDGSLGMHLRSASEELSDSESDEADETADPTPVVSTEPQREPAPFEQDPKNGEAASSVGIVAPAEIGGVEENEPVVEDKSIEVGELDA